MSSLEIVKPTIINDIEFYVSSDGTQVGVSQVGLARLCGVPETTMRRTLASLADCAVRHKWANTSLEMVLNDQLDRPLDLAISSGNQAKVIDGEIAAAIIYYYAEESPRKTQEAKFSLKKFALKGFQSWVKGVVGYTEVIDNSKLLLTIQQVLGEVQELNSKFAKTEGYRVASVEMVGLKQMMENVPVGSNILEGSEVLFTLVEWCESYKGVTLSKSLKHSLANSVAAVYKVMKMDLPAKKRSDKHGCMVQAYPEKHFFILSQCFSKLMAA